MRRLSESAHFALGGVKLPCDVGAPSLRRHSAAPDVASSPDRESTHPWLKVGTLVAIPSDVADHTKIDESLQRLFG